MSMQKPNLAQNMGASKENFPPSLSPPSAANLGKELSVEQKRRIDQNFRAAKAILSRKRPHIDSSKSALCHSPLSWRPLLPYERSHGDPEHTGKSQEMATPAPADCKLVKSSDKESSNKPVNPYKDFTMQRWSDTESSNKPSDPYKNCAMQRFPVDTKSSNKPSYPYKDCTMQRFPLVTNSNKPSVPYKNCAIQRFPVDTKSSSKPSYPYKDCTMQRFPLATNSNKPLNHFEDIPILRNPSDAQSSNNKALHSHNDRTMRKLLPLDIEETLLPEADLDENTLKQLDALCEARVPLAQLSRNKPPLDQDSGLISQYATPFSNASMEDGCNEAISCALTGEHICKSKSSSFTGLDSLSRMSSMVELCNSSTDEASPIPLSVSSPEQPSMQVKAELLPVENGLSDGLSNSSCSLTYPPGSESNISLQSPNPMVDTVAVHTSPSPSSSFLEAASSEFSVSASEVMPAYLQTLNDSQKEAVFSDIQKPLLILAGPGSGKTSTMVARLLRLLSEGVHATNILAMTFTTAAATEMKDRAGAHVGKLISKELNVCTFHSFCLQLCRSHAEKLGCSPEFLVYGHGQQRKAVVEATRLALSEFQSSKPVGTVPNVSITAEDQWSDGLINPMVLKERAKKWDKFVAQAKASGRTPDCYQKLGNFVGAAVLKHYNSTLAACDALDYHDLINCAVALLRDNFEVLNQCLTTWTCVMVDEFQDTSTMQYELLCLLASHKRVTVVGDDDQSIFSFNGADSNNFETFRKDFSELKEVRLQHNYRSTRCIVEAAAALIGNNSKRCENKQALTENDFGERITIKECRNDDAQCCFVIDTIIMKAQMDSTNKPTYGNCAILYRRQVTGKVFQSAFRSRKLPFNIHGVAFYRKKIVKNVIAMLWTALDSESIYCSRVFKAVYGGDKNEAKKVVEYVDKVAKASQCNFLEAARKIFTAKVSGTFSRRQLACGRKVLTVIDAVYRLARKEHSLSTLVTTVVNLIPQRSAFQKRAVVDVDEGKFLNEDDDPRTVLEYLLDDVSDFLCNHFNLVGECTHNLNEDQRGCLFQLKLFLDHMTLREVGNFKTRRQENKNSVTLTTMHQSKGLEWEIVFIVKANDSELPLIHETMGSVHDGAMSLEEERRLLYVAMTRAKKKLYILYVTWDNNQQLLRPTRFLRELPRHLLDYQVDGATTVVASSAAVGGTTCLQPHDSIGMLECQRDVRDSSTAEFACDKEKKDFLRMPLTIKTEDIEWVTSTDFLKGFNVDARSAIASIFHSWAKKPAFQDPKRLLNKVCFVLDERMRSKTSKNKDTLRALKCSLDSKDALLYAQHVLKWVQIPQEERTLLLSEKQEHFQQKGAERSMGSIPATSKQVSYLRSLGCTIVPDSRLHASRLIEQYKKL